MNVKFNKSFASLTNNNTLYAITTPHVLLMLIVIRYFKGTYYNYLR